MAKLTKAQRMERLRKLSDEASSGEWFASANTPYVLGPEADDDSTLFEIVARMPALRRHDGDRRRQWVHDRIFIAACVNEIRRQMDEDQKARLRKSAGRAALAAREGEL